MADNILALFIAPYEPRFTALQNFNIDNTASYQLAPNYLYDSRRFQWESSSALARVTRHQLPPNLEVSLVVLDEGTWDGLSEPEAIQQGESLLAYMAGRFQQSSTYHSDLNDLLAELDSRRLGHKILTRVLPLDGSAGRLPLPPRTSTATTAGP